jgi:membrane-associated HD superfamily phosphohydrolase
MMLADGCEARMRAERPKDEEELRDMIKNVIDTRLEMEQLNETDLTFKDLEEITNSFIATLRGVYHPRIEYPKAASGGIQNEQPIPHSVWDEEQARQSESTTSS